MKFNFTDKAESFEGAVVVGVYEGQTLTPSAEAFDKETSGALARALKSTKFQGKKNEIISIVAPHGITASRLLAVGLGKKESLNANDLENLGGSIAANILATQEKHLTVIVSDWKMKGLTESEISAHVAHGANLRSHRFDKYRTKEEDSKKPKLKDITIVVKTSDLVKNSETLFANLKAVADGVFYTRNLVSEPANVIYPKSFVETLDDLKKLGVKVEILGEKEMRKLGMNALLGVAQGSAQEAQLAIIEWNGASKQDKPIAFVGKGVTFDTGGISIKPADGMEEMKWDMGGAGTVAGLIKALAARKAKVNAIGVMGLVENMPSGTAQRPGDVVTSMSGQTIEVINTDAEGRLVLADALWYTQDRFKPELMIDLATLTGAIIVALGSEYAGLYSNNDTLAQRLYDASLEVDEKLWRMPLHDSYDKDINCDIADMKNVGAGRKGGSITAAHFVKRFVNDVPWAHLDIAGVAWSSKDQALYEKGATGFGVRLLDRFVAKHYEKK